MLLDRKLISDESGSEPTDSEDNRFRAAFDWYVEGELKLIGGMSGRRVDKLVRISVGGSR